MQKIIFIFILFCVVSIHGLQAQDPAEAVTLIPPDPIILQDLFLRTNALRERYSRHHYIRSPELDLAAQRQAEYLVSTGRRGHYRPDGSRPSTRIHETGFVTTGWCCGENYYMSIDATPDMVFDFWRWSPSHVVNVLHRDFTHMGLGMSSDGYRIAYVTVFAEAFDPNALQAETHIEAVAVVYTEGSTEPIEQPPQDAVEPMTEVTTQIHNVSVGETLFIIATRYGVSINTLLEVNAIRDVNLIYVGQRLNIPVSPPP